MLEPAMEEMVAALIPAVAAIGGFFTYLRSRARISDRERGEMVSLLMGLAQHQIVFKGLEYIERGWVTTDEYEDLRRYLYDPYHRLGGNGAAERIMHAVERLPFRSEAPNIQKAFAIDIRESDPTGIPLEHSTVYTGEEKRDRHSPERNH